MVRKIKTFDCAPGAKVEFETKMFKYLAHFGREYKNYNIMVEITKKKWLENTLNKPSFSKTFPLQRGSPPLEIPAPRAFGAFSKQIWRFSLKKMWLA